MQVATVFSLSIIFELAGVSASAVSWDSPVNVNETQLGSVASIDMKAVSGHLVRNYTLRNAPVYREGYPLYQYFIAFPKNKAARISYEEEELLNAGGALCLGEAPEKKTLQQGIDADLINFIYASRVDGGFLMTSPTKIRGKFDIQDNKTKIFQLTVLARYDTPIVEGTDCNQVQMTVHGRMVSMNQTNPNATSQPTRGNPMIEPTKSTQSITNERIAALKSQASKLLSPQAAVVLFAFINTGLV